MEQNDALINVKSGKLQGIYEDGLYVFKGIPYAAPPTGKLRWMPPQPVESWSGTRDATRFGAICPQDKVPFKIPGQKTSQEPQSENCLFLNIWTPAIDNGKRAVMFWIHSGGFSKGSGSASETPGKTLPKRGGVVLVTINYRLGALGFLNLKQVTNGRIMSTGNEGILDQIAALRWVHDNIAVFGGDPDNVTVFGQSAGAESIGALLATPQAKGLFRKAILQSGASKSRSLESAAAVAEKYLGKLGLTVNDVKALKSMEPAALIKAQMELEASATIGVSAEEAWGPVRDGEVLSDTPLDAIEHGSAKDITVLAGANLEEGKLLALMEGPDVQKIDETEMVRRVKQLVPKQYATKLIEKYRLALAKRGLMVTPYLIYAAIMGDQHFRMPNIRLCEFQEKLGSPSYGYTFTWKAAAPDYGACHFVDVGFIFGKLNEELHGCSFEAWKLACDMQDAWIAFAKTGDPSCPGLGTWLTYGDDRNMMVLGVDSCIKAAPYDMERAAWDGIPNNILG